MKLSSRFTGHDHIAKAIASKKRVLPRIQYQSALDFLRIVPMTGKTFLGEKGQYLKGEMPLGRFLLIFILARQTNTGENREEEDRPSQFESTRLKNDFHKTHLRIGKGNETITQLKQKSTVGFSFNP